MIKWEEHCTECAMPECYKVCSLYEKREDGACARFVYGIVPNYIYKGHYNFGADIKFRKWGKIEANLSKSFATRPISHKWLDKLLLENRKYTGLSDEKHFGSEYDSFIIECFTTEEESFNLLLEYFVLEKNLRSVKFRWSCEINPGHNFYEIPFRNFNIYKPEGFLYLAPENSDSVKRLIFTWLDFVKFKRRNSIPPGNKRQNILTKIKCVAWDLDNTIWKGILSEDSIVEPNPDALTLVKELDKKGILQTIVSKNDFDPAWKVLQTIGISEFFLHPLINWDKKSENLEKIAQKLNISLDTFAVIDDSPFERLEIKNAFPNVRVYPETSLSTLIHQHEFDVPVTVTGVSRRQQYLKNNEREQVKGTYDKDQYNQFLIDCKMCLDIFRPSREDELRRCWELIQRSNQLNLSGKKYPWPQFMDLLAKKNNMCLALRCIDRFGDYGIIGFCGVYIDGKSAVLFELVLSCRIAQKKIEHALLKSLIHYLSSQGYKSLQVLLIKSLKNKPMREVFRDLPFDIISSNKLPDQLRIELNKEIKEPDIMKINFSY